MNDIVTAQWPLFVIGALVVVILLWWLLIASRRTRVSVDKRDTLDEGAARAARNQALIDAPPVAASAVVPPIVPDAIGGAGVAVAAAAQEARIEAESDAGDDLTRIKGLGPKLASTLRELGVTRFDQIAAWSDADIDRIDSQLGRFQGRIRRDDWVEQARLLARGDAAGFETKFGAV
jgi:predicted flap endonuclease-1-like 5' DNA nuclease